MPALRDYPSVLPDKPNHWLQGESQNQQLIFRELFLRFKDLLCLFSECMTIEAYPTDSACEEWSDYLQDLQWALTFLNKRIAGLTSVDRNDDATLKLIETVCFCDDQISLAIDSLSNNTLDSSKRITKAIDALQCAVYRINRVESDVVSSPRPRASRYLTLDGRLDVKTDYEKSIAGLSRYLDGNLTAPDLRTELELKIPENKQDDIQDTEYVVVIAASRKVFLNAILYIFMSPSEWMDDAQKHRLLRILDRVRSKEIISRKPDRYALASRSLWLELLKLSSGSR